MWGLEAGAHKWGRIITVITEDTFSRIEWSSNFPKLNIINDYPLQLISTAQGNRKFGQTKFDISHRLGMRAIEIELVDEYVGTTVRAKHRSRVLTPSQPWLQNRASKTSLFNKPPESPDVSLPDIFCGVNLKKIFTKTTPNHLMK